MERAAADRRFLFVCGCPRSGTTAMWRLLAASPEIVIGVERYGRRFITGSLSPDLFEPDRFLRCEKGDTFYDDLESFRSYYSFVGKHFATARFVGDKIPELYKTLDRLIADFPPFKLIFMFRNVYDVAASYRTRRLDPDDGWRRDTGMAIRDWNQALEAYFRFRDDIDILPLVFEDALMGSPRWLETLWHYLEITDPMPLFFRHGAIRARACELERGRSRELDQVDIERIEREADVERYAEVVECARRRLGW